MIKITDKQNEVLDAIKEYYNQYGFSPTIRELCEMTHKSSPATIHLHLKGLKRKGYIDYQYNKNRTIKVIEGEK